MSPTTIEDSQLTEASAPFNRTDGDVILLSSDQVKFSCHKAILAISSPFFSDMFSLPAAKQADLASNDQPALADGTPIIPITETSKVIDTLLRSIYPVAALPLYDIAVIAEVLHAGRKYQMPEGPGIAALSRAFDSFTVNDPLRVFFISCRFGMEEKAAATARWLLLVTPILSELRKLIVSSPGDIPEAPGMNYATAGSFFRLRWYLKEGGKVNGSFRFLHPSPLDGTTQPSSDSSDTSSCASTGSNESSDDTTSWLTSSGLLTRLPADIHIRSLIDSTVDIPSHKFILALSSPVLADEISRATVNAPDSLPAIFLPESGELISHLLRCCYGSFASLFIDSKYLSVASETLVQVVDAAKKYSMDKVVEAARIILQPYLSADPIPAYYVSVACGWEREAREAARHSVDLDAAQVTDTYASQMENCTAVAYLRLLDLAAFGISSVSSELKRHQSTAGSLLRDSLFSTLPQYVQRHPGGNQKLSATSTRRELGKQQRHPEKSATNSVVAFNPFSGTTGPITDPMDSTIADLATENRNMDIVLRVELEKVELEFGGGGGNS